MMTKLLWAKLKSPFLREGRSSSSKMRSADSLTGKLTVNEEYKEAFRTKSYVEMWSKVQEQLGNTCIDGADDKVTSSASASASTSLPFYLHLSDYLFRPHQEETLSEMIKSLELHNHLVDYFDASLEACRICDLLLQCIQQTRAHYKRIRRVIKLCKKVKDSADYSDKLRGAVFTELATYAMHENPLSTFVGSVKFHEFHGNNMELLHGLTEELRRIRWKEKFRRICRKVGGCCLVISHTALLISLLVMAIHSMVGIVAAPGLMGCSVYVLRKQIKLMYGEIKPSLIEKRICAQLDLAAKGTYILINDFDTMSRMVRGLFDEVEHRKYLADMCVRNKKTELFKEVVKEFQIHDSFYVEQLEELERHIYLCFHTINKSRRLVMEEIMAVPDNVTADDHQQKTLGG